MEAIQPYLPWIIQAAAGAVGGNLIGVARGPAGLGPLANTVLGAAGGLGAAFGLGASGHGGQALAFLGNNPTVVDSVAGLVGGLVLALLASFFKRGS